MSSLTSTWQQRHLLIENSKLLITCVSNAVNPVIISRNVRLGAQPVAEIIMMHRIVMLERISMVIASLSDVKGVTVKVTTLMYVEQPRTSMVEISLKPHSYTQLK